MNTASSAVSGLTPSKAWAYSYSIARGSPLLHGRLYPTEHSVLIFRLQARPRKESRGFWRLRLCRVRHGSWACLPYLTLRCDQAKRMISDYGSQRITISISTSILANGTSPLHDVIEVAERVTQIRNTIHPIVTSRSSCAIAVASPMNYLAGPTFRCDHQLVHIRKRSKCGSCLMEPFPWTIIISILLTLTPQTVILSQTKQTLKYWSYLLRKEHQTHSNVVGRKSTSRAVRQSQSFDKYHLKLLPMYHIIAAATLESHVMT